VARDAAGGVGGVCVIPATDRRANARPPGEQIMAVLLIIVGLLFGLLGGCNFLVAITSDRNVARAVGAATVGFALFVPGLLMFIYGVKSWGRQSEATGNTKKCPFCAEMIKPDAKVCRYCRRDLTGADG
jgi:hypothetical protein